MSKQEKNRDFDPSKPSTSGYRKPKTSSPYSRPEERSHKYSHREHKRIKSESGYSEASQSSSVSTKYEVKEEMMETSEEMTTIKSEISETESIETKGRQQENIFVTRPKSLVSKKGVSGHQIVLQTNQFKMITVPNWGLYMYRVDFTPEENRTVVRKGMLRLYKEKVGAYLFDGTLLYTTRRIPDKLELNTIRQSDNEKITISIRLVGDVMPEDRHYMAVFNVLVRKCLGHLQLQLVGRDYYDAKDKIIIARYKLEMWPGYITSIRRHEQNILMTIELSHKILRQDTLYNILEDCYRSGRDYKQSYLNAVIGTVVLTDYNNHTYRIEDVDFDVSPASTFNMKGQEISYIDYYSKKYSINISHPTQPMLVTRVKRKDRNVGQDDLVYLVPELCRATGLNDSMKENFHLMKDVATYTRLRPQARIERLLKFNGRLRQEPKVEQELKDWEIKLDSNLVEVTGRVLPSDRLTFGRNLVVSCREGDWSRNMQRAPLFYGKELRNWVIMGTHRSSHSIMNFVEMIRRVGREMAFIVDVPYVHWLNDDKANAYAEGLENVLSKGCPQLIFCVVSNNRSDRYSTIKKKLCVDRPVPSQLFLQKNLNGRNTMSIATKVAIQMNCKLGGAPWRIDVPIKGLMAIGFDVCRDAKTKGRDFLSMVATVNQTLTRFVSAISIYHSNEELAEQLCANIRKAVQQYREINKALPMYLIIYRDGVSDGQVQEVYTHEVENLKKHLEKIYYGPNFKMIYILVSKKIAIRFFNRRENPPVGTIVDDVVTNPLKYDFYLVSQQVRQGTISPTAYNIISDNSGLEPDVIQTITFKLCHLYYNCTSTVRVPAVCHYARKFATLIGRFVHQPPNSQLEHYLFYL